MGHILTKLKEILFQRKIDIVLLGLENSGKTTLLNQLSQDWQIPSTPTIGLNVKQVKKHGIVLKIWDLGGQIQFRPVWKNYAQGCDLILFLIDVSNEDSLILAKKELYILLDNQKLHGIPILFIGNKIDYENHLNQKKIVESLNLDYINSNQWGIVLISALNGTNLQRIMTWIIDKSK